MPCAAMSASTACSASRLEWMSEKTAKVESAMPLESKTTRDDLPLAGVAFELLAELRVGDRDEGAGAFGDGFALEVHHPEFGDDEHHVAERGGDDVAGLEA